MSSIRQYQQRVLGPTEVVDYSTTVMQCYPPVAIRTEPFIGFKVLCRDTNAFAMPPADRLGQIDANLGFLVNTGCIVRETKGSMKDGLWVITMPVPRRFVSKQLQNLMNVLQIFENDFGIIPQGLAEVNVSGRCEVGNTEMLFRDLQIPQSYMSCLQVPNDTMYRLGHVIRINNNFMCLRTRWNFNNLYSTQDSVRTFESLTVLAQLISSMYH